MQFRGRNAGMSFVVIDGLDGCGKSTQFEALKKVFGEDDTIYISFPDYSRDSSVPVRLYLVGEISSDPDDVNPYAASSFYAVDRYISYRQVWEDAYKNGKSVIAGRYVSSNAIHQMGKLPEEEWDKFLEWLADYEYSKLGLPRPDKVIFLDMPPETAQKLLSVRYKENGGGRDIHELDMDYFIRCRKSALYAVKMCGWDMVSCADENGEPFPPEVITEKLTELIKGL